MSIWCRSFSRAAPIHPWRRCTSTVCADATRTTSSRPCSRPSAGRCVWRSRPTRAWVMSCRQRKEACKSFCHRDAESAETGKDSRDEPRVTGKPPSLVRCAGLGGRGLGEARLDALRRNPFSGICLGLQALYERSEEGGGTACLGIL